MVKYGDIFFFDGDKYRVEQAYLNNASYNANDRIFSVLGLNEDEFCSKAYGYKSTDGTWPQYNVDDYAAAERVIIALVEECKKQGVSYVLPEDFKFNVKTMSSIKESFLIGIKSEPQKSFRKAGITNGDDLLTSEGQEVFLAWLLAKNGTEFKKEVVDQILKEQDKK